MRDGRVEIPREGFVEWYVNGPLGLEQGFNVAAAPSCEGAKGEALEVELALGEGLSAALVEGGEQLALRNREGHRVLGVSELYAIDATGRALSARLGVTGEHGVSMRVETAGAVYPLVIDPLVWKERQKLLASDAAADDYFGASVTLSGDTALIGAPNHVELGLSTGAAYVFVRSASFWVHQQKLVASDGAQNDEFGSSVALSGDTALIGAALNATKGKYAGAVYVFVRQGSSWIQQQKILASDGVPDDEFGSSLALSGDTALIGASGGAEMVQSLGAVYVFVRQGSSWIQQQKLVASDGAVGDKFGYSVALSSDTALVGADGNDAKGQGAGVTYVFVRSGASWIQQQKLFANDAEANDGFGGSLALSGDTALIGAPYASTKGQYEGAAYIFIRSGSSWTQQQELLADDAAPRRRFGASVALSSDTALIGAPGDPTTGTLEGAAFVFIRSGSSWIQQQELFAGNGAADDQFGNSLALAGDTAFVGAFFNAAKGFGTGAAYIFVRPASPCSKDTDCAAPPPENCALAFCRSDNTCGTRPKLDGAPCPGGVCIASGCLADTPSSTSSTTSVSSAQSTGATTSASSTAATSTSAESSTGTGNTADTTATAATGAGGAPREPAELRLHGGACVYAPLPSPGRDALGVLAPLLLVLRPLLRRSRSPRP